MLATTSTWATCLAEAAALAAAAAVFPSTLRFFHSCLASQEALVAAVVSQEVASPVAGGHEEEVSPAVALANRAVASTSVDKGPRMMMVPARQCTLLTTRTTSRLNNREREAVWLTREESANLARARHHGGALRWRRLRSNVTSNYSTLAGLARSFWLPLLSSPSMHRCYWCWSSAACMC